MPQVFSKSEMQQRTLKLQEIMDERGLACVIASSIHASFYYSGFWFSMPYGRYGATVVPRSGEPVLITPKMEGHRARDFTWLKDVRTYSDAKRAIVGLTDLVREVVEEKGVSKGKVGVEEEALTLTQWKVLQSALSSATFVDVSELTMRQRLIKSEEEIALTKQGAEICIEAAKAAQSIVKEGSTEIEVAAAAEEAIERECIKRFPEFEYTGGQGWCKTGRRSTYGHTGPSGKRLKKGEIIQFGSTPIIMGYYHTLMRQKVLGPVPSFLKKPYAVRLEAVNRCLQAIEPGVPCSRIDKIVFETLEEAGLQQYKGFGTGHSFGLMGPFWGREEAGELRIYNHTPLQKGMIVSMEPSIYIPEMNSALLTVDMVLVTQKGCEVLTEYPREIASV